MMNCPNINIIIVDSGVDLTHKRFQEIPLTGFSFQNGVITEDYQDTFGHGTAIFDIVKSVSDIANIINIKITNTENTVHENDLIGVLQYIKSNMKCDILNLSLGINICNHYNELKEICDEIASSGTMIVSAFDNSGSISYPAAFKSVIGVITGPKCSRIDDFQYYEDDIINIAAKGGIQRVAWNNSKYIMMAGNSFACAHVTVQIAKIMKEGYITATEIKEKLRNISLTKNKFKEYKENAFELKINRAAIFPFNKEMHSLVRYEKLLGFDLIDVYETKYSSVIGASTSFLLNEPNIKDYKIKNINDIDWATIDTLIIGHTDRLSSLINDKELKIKLVKDALSKGKKIYSFDNLHGLGFDNSPQIYYPMVTNLHLPPFRFGMLYRISKPVVGVFGTSSQQGKFTLQLKLRDLLLSQGYNVGQVGTEPSAYLFGMDYCYPMGYNSSVFIKEYEQITYLNHIMNQLCEEDKDLILVGSQSGTVPYDIGNIKMFNMTQFHFLMGTQPDCVILVINPFDNILYIERTKKFIESCARCKVISMIIFPMNITNDWSGVYGKKRKMDINSISDIKNKFENYFKLPVFCLGNDMEMSELMKLIIDYFAN